MTIETAADTQERGADLVLVAALCPLLATSDMLVNALSIGAATILVALVSSSIVAVLARWFDDDTRLIACLLVTATVLAIVELAMRAWFHVARESLGVFLSLIIANLAIVHHMRAREPAGRIIARIFKLTFTITLVLVILGVAREIVGRGSILHEAQALIGSLADEITLFRVDMGFLLAMLPPGAFLSLGLLLALRNWIRDRRSAA